MGILSDSTMGNLKMDTKVSPFDSIKEIFAKAFGSIFDKNNDKNGETIEIKDKDVLIAEAKIECQKDGQYLLSSNYDASKYLGDSRAIQCKPDEHIVRNMSPVELSNFLKGETIAPISEISRNILNDGGEGRFCFSPETPVYLGVNFASSHQRMGRFITPESIAQLQSQEKMRYDGKFYVNDFPQIENLQVVFKIEDKSVYEHIFPTCEGRTGLDPCFGSVLHEDRPFVDDGDNYDCEIRLPSYDDTMLSILSIDGVDVRGFSKDEIDDLISDLIYSRQEGTPSDNFLENNPQYTPYYDTSHIVTDDDYVQYYSENDRSYLDTNGYSQIDDYLYFLNNDDNDFQEWEDYDD